MKKNPLGKALLLVCILSLSTCNHGRLPLHAGRPMEHYGPTDISGIVGGGGLSAAVNDKGTITVFKWPNPSYYDHVKYMTSDRDRPFFGALANEGVFTGVFCETDDGEGFNWLREWDSSQRYLFPDSLILLTRFESGRLGLAIEQTDVADPELGLLRRSYKIILEPGSPVKSARLVIHTNFNPMVSKITSFPFQDTSLEHLSGSMIAYDPASDALIQSKSGADLSTGKANSVFIALGLGSPPDGYQAGLDSIALPLNPRLYDPFFQARKGKMGGRDFAWGQVSAGLIEDLDFSEDDEAEVDFFIAVSGTKEGVRKVLAKGREIPLSEAVGKERGRWRAMTASCPMPDTDDPRVLQVARLSLLVMLAAYCDDTGAVVAAISTQSPYGEDWPRDGAFINEALAVAGLHDLVERHNLFYIEHQATPGHPVFFRVPSGSWAPNYYADGVPGMHVNFWQIDTTGFALLTLWRHYQATGDRAYLELAYPAMARTADFLAGFRDPRNGLQKKAHEFDMMERKQTIVGALTALLGLRSAVGAAREMNDRPSLKRWSARAEELQEIVLRDFYNEKLGCFTSLPDMDTCAGFSQSWILWPEEIIPLQDPRAQAVAENLWQSLQPSLQMQKESGQYEIIPIMALARAWKHDPDKLARVRKALVWEANVMTNSLGHFGEAWVNRDGRVIVGQAQPHVTNHALFYAASIEAFGAAR